MSETSPTGNDVIPQFEQHATGASQIVVTMPPGWKTSEFWLALLVHVLNGVALTFPADLAWVKVAAILSSTMVQMGYGQSRQQQQIAAMNTNASNGIATAPTTHGTVQPQRFHAMFLLVMLGVLFAGGCVGKTPTARWAETRAALTATQDIIVQQKKAGVISNADYVAIYPFFKSAQGALERAKAQLPNGGTNFEFFLDLAKDVLTKIEAYQAGDRPEGKPNARDTNTGRDRVGQGVHRLPRLAGQAAGADRGNYARAA